MDQHTSPGVQLRMLSKWELRCILKNPSIRFPVPGDFQPISQSKFAEIVEPLFSDPEYAEALKKIPLESYKKMKTLPVKLVRIILQEQGITIAEGAHH
jgi:hypothetical protein